MRAINLPVRHFFAETMLMGIGIRRAHGRAHGNSGDGLGTGRRADRRTHSVEVANHGGGRSSQGELGRILFPHEGIVAVQLRCAVRPLGAAIDFEDDVAQALRQSDIGPAGELRRELEPQDVIARTANEVRGRTGGNAHAHHGHGGNDEFIGHREVGGELREVKSRTDDDLPKRFPAEHEGDGNKADQQERTIHFDKFHRMLGLRTAGGGWRVRGIQPVPSPFAANSADNTRSRPAR